MPGLVPGIHVLILWMRQRWDRPGHDGADHERHLPLVDTDRGYGIQPHEGSWPTSVAVIVTTFPRTVRVIEHMLIPLKDGTKLAARIWLPDDAEQNPVPAILEYLPYRKRDGTYERDALTHPYLAGHGYAGVRVDMRGCGESDGLLFDEYAKQEQDDGLEVIAWLAAQPWCNGAVGMMGISWGGFNGLQNVPLFFELWLRHQRRDAYWKHGSVCEDYPAIQCPVYAVGGWTDAYKNAIPRLLERLKVPRKGLI